MSEKKSGDNGMADAWSFLPSRDEVNPTTLRYDFGDFNWDEKKPEPVPVVDAEFEWPESWYERFNRETVERDEKSARFRADRTKLLEAVSGEMGEEAYRAERDSIRARMTAHVDPARHDAFNETYIGETIDDLMLKPQMKELYFDTFFSHDQRLLKEKTAHQIEDLRDYFLSREGSVKRLAIFREYVKNMHVVHSSKGDGNLKELKSPKLLGKSQDGFYDLPVHGEDYLYASFAEMPHEMARSAANSLLAESDAARPWREQKDYLINKGDIANLPSEIIMNDIADVSVIANRTGQGFMEMYLNNTFDFEGGQEVIAYYLASVFESPDEISSFFGRHNKRLAIQDFYKEVSPTFHESDGTKQRRTDEILRRMRELLAALKIAPPIQVEVRIPGKVKVDRVL